MLKTWSCKIGEVDESRLPEGSDAPMRAAVREAYARITGEQPAFIFSGWGGELDTIERSVVNNKPQETCAAENERVAAEARELLDRDFPQEPQVIGGDHSEEPVPFFDVDTPSRHM